MITSTSNGQVKQVVSLLKKAKSRKESGLFVVEGIRMVSEVPAEDLESLFVSESFAKQTKNNKKVSDWSETISYEVVSDSVFRHMSDTMTPQGILAVVKQKDYGLKQVIKEAFAESKCPCFLVLENIQDPGNLGTIFRTAEGAGVSGIFMSRNTVDIYNPKVIRSTMGTIFRMPFVIEDDLLHTIEELQNNQVRIYAAHLKGQENFYEKDFRRPTAFLVGNEGNGLTDLTASMADEYLKIPMEGRVESLNAAVSASLLVYEAKRQRDHEIQV